jgi:hypothetical protein
MPAIISEGEASAEITLYLTENPAIVDKLNRMEPARSYREISRLAARLEGGGNGRPVNGHRPRPVSRAPAPITPVGMGHRSQLELTGEEDYSETSCNRTSAPTAWPTLYRQQLEDQRDGCQQCQQCTAPGTLYSFKVDGGMTYVGTTHAALDIALHGRVTLRFDRDGRVGDHMHVIDDHGKDVRLKITEKIAP